MLDTWYQVVSFDNGPSCSMNVRMLCGGKFNFHYYLADLEMLNNMSRGELLELLVVSLDAHKIPIYLLESNFYFEEVL